MIVLFENRLSPSEVQPKPPRPCQRLTGSLACTTFVLFSFSRFSVLMTCIEKSSSKAVLTDITNIASAQPFNTIIDYLLPGRLTASPPSEPPPNFERPATPLGVRTPDLEDLEPEQDLASACSRIVSESWEGLSEALQNAKETLRSSVSDSSALQVAQTTPPPALPYMTQDRPKLPRRIATRKSLKQLSMPPARPPARLRYHGHSNSALADYKYFWNSRCEDWMRYEAELEEASLIAYDGIKVNPDEDRKSAPPSRCPRFRRNGKTEREREMDEVGSAVSGYRGKYVPDLTAPIYPRTGDLALLHHPRVLEMELCFVSFPLHKIHQIFFAFSLDQRFERDHFQVGTRCGGSQEGTIAEDERTVYGKTTEDSSFWSEDTLVEDEDLILYPSDRKLNGRYQEVGLWEVDWATKWEVLMKLFREHELEYKGKTYGMESPEGDDFEALGPYRAALADNLVVVGFLDEREGQLMVTGSEPDFFEDFEDIVVC